MQEKKLLTGLFRQHNNAGKAYNAALKYGYQKDEINILMSAETKQKHSYQRKHPDLSTEGEIVEGAGVGGALGVTTGAITGALMALGTFVVISGNWPCCFWSYSCLALRCCSRWNCRWPSWCFN
jgi:hypothetical protein